MSARTEVLTRIRQALGPAHGQAPAISRGYQGAAATGGPAPADVLDLLVDRLVDYKASVVRTTAGRLAADVAMAAARHGVRRLVIPVGVPSEWLAGLADVEVLREDPALPVAVLDDLDGVVTGCRVAIAATGTIVLDAGPDQGRRALTLVPDWHLCVVTADQVVPGVPDGIARLDPAHPLTFISGPSATSDIELQRVEGVHGPRTLVVVIVEE